MDMDSPTILVAQFAHETNTFSNHVTDRSDFQEQHELFGEEIPDQLTDTNTEIGGMIDIASRQNASICYTVVAESTPGGPVSQDTYEFYRDEIIHRAQEAESEIAGAVLALHGAMVPEHLQEGEGNLISALRNNILSDIPIFVTIDPNANVSDRLIDTATGLVAYETTPHVDMRKIGRKAFKLVLETVRDDIRPVMHIERPPIIPFGSKTISDEPPMERIHTLARNFEQKEPVLKINVCQGFAQSDVPHMGFSLISLTNNNKELAKDTARELAELVWEYREAFTEELLSPEEGVELAQSAIEDGSDQAGPIVIAEMNDNPGGGGPADGTILLSEIVSKNIQNAGFALIRDPEAVDTLIQAGVGNEVTVTIGGKSGDSQLQGKPLKISGYIKSITDGKYTNTGNVSTGAVNNLGRSVRFQCGAQRDLELILAENRLQPYDLEIWRHHGIQPERLDLIGLKSAVHYQTNYKPMASKIIPTNGPGLTSMDPTVYNFFNIERPLYPIDVMDDDDYPSW